MVFNFFMKSLKIIRKIYGNISILGGRVWCVFRELNPAPYYTPYVLFGAEVLKRGVILRTTYCEIKKLRAAVTQCVCVFRMIDVTSVAKAVLTFLMNLFLKNDIFLNTHTHNISNKSRTAF
jgi:hypothetical protein